MSAQTDVAPIIIKKKKVSGGDGHHGGAWKVAYADFVTAMMAFFMLMWLLNATTEKQRKGIADYFSPTIAVARVSGGGDGAFGGDSVFTEKTLPKNGTGATSLNATSSDMSSGGMETNVDADGEAEAFKEVESALMGRGGESMVMDNQRRHIVTRVTDDGLVIELFSLDDTPLFEGETSTPTPMMEELALIVSDVSQIVTNPIAVEGHVRSVPVVVQSNPVWSLSSDRAMAVRSLLETSGIAHKRTARVTGHADRNLMTPDPMAIRNDRIEIIFLRTNI